MTGRFSWSDVAPASVATAQDAWERRMRLSLAKETSHLTLAQLGACCGRSSARMQQMITLASEQRGALSPIERFLRNTGLHGMTKGQARRLQAWLTT